MGELVRAGHAVAAALLVVGVVVGPTPLIGGADVPVRAAASAPTDDLLAETHSVFVVDPAAAAVHVTVDMTLTSQAGPNWLFYGYSLPVLEAATNIVATRGSGAQQSVSIDDNGNPFTNLAEISLRPNLGNGEALTIHVSYDLPNQAPRSDGVRVTDAFVGFPAFSPGDPGLSSLEVHIPDSYEVEVGGDQLQRGTGADGEIVLSATAIADPDFFTAIVIGSDDDHLVSRSVDVNGTPVDIRGWPDDPEWVEFAVQHVGWTAPALVNLIGQPWPDRNLEIVETQAPLAHGYGGWYDENEHAISIGDQLDARLIAHEMAHIWFNSNLFAERWINEGFAEEYATQALDAQGQVQEPPPAPDRAGDGAVSLNEWSEPSIREREDHTIQNYGYAASWYVISQIVDEVGVVKLREVFAAVNERTMTYLGDPEVEGLSGVGNWQRLLDLLEESAGSQQAAGLFDTFVVSEDERPLMAERGAARTVYAALEERGGEWTPPLEVRKFMAQWNFEAAGRRVEQANQVLDIRDEILGVLEGTEVERISLEDSYEAAKQVEDVVPVADETLAAAKAYRDAEERHESGPGNIIGSVGMLWSGPSDQLDEARAGLEDGDLDASMDASAAVEKRLDNATRDGGLRLGGTAGLALGVWFGTNRLRRWRRHRGMKPPPVPMPATAWPPTSAPPTFPGLGGPLPTHSFPPPRMPSEPPFGPPVPPPPLPPPHPPPPPRPPGGAASGPDPSGRSGPPAPPR